MRALRLAFLKQRSTLTGPVRSRTFADLRQPTMETSEAPSGGPATEAPKLPKLSPAEFQVYNRLADIMDQFHNNFRRTWKELYAASSTGKRPANRSLRQFINTGLEFCHHLEMHHSIEESYFFPILAKKQPAFRKELELLTQHKQIHKGLEKFQEYLEACRNGERELRMEELKVLMDTFGGVLWEHLDDEVKELGAENMRKYWTMEEMRRMPI